MCLESMRVQRHGVLYGYTDIIIMSMDWIKRC